VENGRAYLTNGDVLDANTGLQLGVFSVAPSQNANGPVVADSTLGKGFVLVNPNFGANYQINAYDLSTFVVNGSLPVSGINSFYRNPTSLRRWGQDGLAFTTGSQVYILRSPIVRDLSTSLADLSLTSSVPASVATGTNLTYQLTITNAGCRNARHSHRQHSRWCDVTERRSQPGKVQWRRRDLLQSW